jgi:hypothetical protein
MVESHLARSFRPVNFEDGVDDSELGRTLLVLVDHPGQKVVAPARGFESISES